MASTWAGVILTYFYSALLLGFLLASPMVAYEVYRYVEPALYPHEKGYLTWFAASFTGLFALGVAFSYYVLIPYTYRFLLRFADFVGAKPFFAVDDFLAFTALVMLAVGLSFTFPVVTTLLVKLDVITPETLTSRWREAVVAVFIIAAVVTPDVSGITMLMLAAPITALYALAVAVAKITYKPHRGRAPSPSSRGAG